MSLNIFFTILVSTLIFGTAQAQVTAELRAGLQNDRSQDPLPDGKKLSLGLGYNHGDWLYLLSLSQIGRSEVGNSTVGTRLTTQELVLWSRYHFVRSDIETYGGIGAGLKLDTANIRLYEETTSEKSKPQSIVGLCGGINLPLYVGANKEQIIANLEIDLLNQPGYNFLEAAILLGLSVRF